MSVNKLPISAMVVGYNEATLLPNCLSSLWFCDEIIYTDLGSIDSSIEIASHFTSKIYTRPIAPSGEYIQSEIVHYTKHNWVIFIDPDEIIDKSLANCLIEVFPALVNDLSIGSVSVPWQFYFKKHKLKGTIWGGFNQKHLLVNKHRFDFLPITHYGRKLKDGYVNYEIALNNNNTNLLHHYWMNSYSVFIKKHMRYLKNEGRDEYVRGRRVARKKILFAPFTEFYYSLITERGYKDSLTGVFLSAFWAFYKTNVYIGIYRVQCIKDNKI